MLDGGAAGLERRRGGRTGGAGGGGGAGLDGGAAGLDGDGAAGLDGGGVAVLDGDGVAGLDGGGLARRRRAGRLDGGGVPTALPTSMATGLRPRLRRAAGLYGGRVAWFDFGGGIERAVVVYGRGLVLG